MKDFKIVTDSCCSLDDETIIGNSLEVLPYFFTIEGQDYPAYDLETKKTVDYVEIYNKMRNRILPTTSQVNEYYAYEFFDNILKSGKDLIYIGFTVALSNSFNNISTALEKLKEKYPKQKILYIDSLSASIGEGMLVLKACEMKNQGYTIEEVYDHIMEDRHRIFHLVTADDLYYLHRGGRLSSASFMIAKTLKIKPLIQVTETGSLEGVAKVIGRKRAIKEMASIVARTAIDQENATVYIVHADCLAEAVLLQNYIKEKAKIKDFHIGVIDCVIGAHVGPGGVGVIFRAKDRKIVKK